MKTVADLEEIKSKLSSIFPNAVRGSVSKSRWGKGRKVLHLCYFIGSDTVGGLIIQAKGDLLYFIDWDTNKGHEYMFAESDNNDMVSRVIGMYRNEVHTIERTVNFGSLTK